MPNWDRTPPVNGMPIAEIKARVKDGIKRRRQTGELRPEGLGNIVTNNAERGFTKKERIQLIRAGELAIYSLANNEPLDYCHAADAINKIRKAGGFLDTTFMAAMLQGVAEQAAAIAGVPFQELDTLARHWLNEFYKPSGKIISIPKGNTNGNKQGKADNLPKATPGKSH